jgi:hypothetical protein
VEVRRVQRVLPLLVALVVTGLPGVGRAEPIGEEWAAKWRAALGELFLERCRLERTA